MENEFWEYLERLVQSSEVVIDRPKGSAHPRFPDLIYPLDYGCMKGINSADGGGIDIWVGNQANSKIEAIVCTIDLHKKDLEIKILIGCSEAEVTTILDFHNSGRMRAILVQR